MTHTEVIQLMKDNGHKVFDNDSKPYNLNIIGVRSNNRVPEKFDDTLYVIWKYKRKWNMLSMEMTTDPSVYYLKNPLSVQGTAIMIPNQYFHVYQLGITKGKECLRQIEAIKFWRDNDKDNVADETNNIINEIIYAHIHRAGHDSTLIGKWSAACQVVANDNNFEHFMDLCKKSVKYWGNKFTYTLIQL